MSNTNYVLISNGNFISENELYHWGVKGMHWGVRRYQNPDGTLTSKGRKKYLKNNNLSYLTKSGKELQSIVRNTASKNTDILRKYDEENAKLKSLKTNDHARKLVNDMDKKYSMYKDAKKEYEKTGSASKKRIMELKYRDYEDSIGTLNYANKRDNDRLWEKYRKELAEKTLKDLGSDVTERGRYFVEILIGDYYKHDID